MATAAKGRADEAGIREMDEVAAAKEAAAASVQKQMADVEAAKELADAAVQKQMRDMEAGTRQTVAGQYQSWQQAERQLSNAVPGRDMPTAEDRGVQKSYGTWQVKASPAPDDSDAYTSTTNTDVQRDAYAQALLDEPIPKKRRDEARPPKSIHQTAFPTKH